MGVESHFQVGGRTSEWKEMHDPQRQLEGPGSDGQKIEKAEILRNKEGMTPSLIWDKALLRHRLNPGFYAARPNVRKSHTRWMKRYNYFAASLH